MNKSISRQTGTRRLRLFLALAVSFAFGIGTMLHSAKAQSGQRGSSNTMPSPQPVIPNVSPLDMPPVYDGDPMRARADERRLQYMNAERQKSMVAATNRLVKLVTELNAQVNGEQRGQLTPDQVRQLADIEKLARSIREKMSTSVRQPSPFGTGPQFMGPR
jgi:hypothetical protein